MRELHLTRVSISLPCKVPVLPGGDSDGPLEARKERCATDAWWFIGAIPVCDQHLRAYFKLVGESYEEFLRDFFAEYPEYSGYIPNLTERLPWSERHRYMEDVAL